jgi:hypothetical protein
MGRGLRAAIAERQRTPTLPSPFQGEGKPADVERPEPGAAISGFRVRARARPGMTTGGHPQKTWMNLLTSTFSGSVPVVTEKSMNF